MTIDVAADRALMNKPLNDVNALIENMAQNHYQWGVNTLLYKIHNGGEGCTKLVPSII